MNYSFAFINKQIKTKFKKLLQQKKQTMISKILLQQKKQTMISKILCQFIILSISFNIGFGKVPNDGKLRVCIVESRGHYRKAPQFCPTLEATSNMECVVGVDRLDCVRRMHKGTAHFGVLSSEDLVAARWASVEILVTSELRSHDAHFEYEIVAVVDNEADIHTVHDLRGAKLCHPGYGLKNHWTDVLANYFESAMVARSCDPEISLSEDHVRASARFFGPSCKAGPWVPNPKQDRQLKDRYPSLCQMCYDPYRCDIGDKHWGRRGALYCLTSGGGSVAWARLDDVKSHFGFSGLQAQANPNEYSYLCADGHLQPINTTNPCIWVAKPWPVIAARRSHAAQVQHLVTGINHDNPSSWQNALLSLLETYHVDINPLDNVIPIDDYLDQAIGFQSAYSFPECNPPRSIVFCTTSIIEHIKCSWLQEAAQVYGVQPNIQCIRSATFDTCMDDIKYKAADVMVVDNEQRLKAQRDYKLKPILFEFSSNMHDLYATVAVVHKDSKFKTFRDLEGAKACLPSYEGPAYLSVLETINNQTGQVIPPHKYFSHDSCLWQHGEKSCSDIYRGDEGALRCLAQGAEVAFISSAVYKQYIVGNITSAWVRQTGHRSFKLLCPYGSNERHSKFEFCYLHWTTRSYIMTHDGLTARQTEIYNSLREIDALFGKKLKEDVRAFTMYGVFDQQNNIIFRDQTDELRGLREMQNDINSRTMEDIYEDYLADKYKAVTESGVSRLRALYCSLVLSLVLMLHIFRQAFAC